MLLLFLFNFVYTFGMERSAEALKEIDNTHKEQDKMKRLLNKHRINLNETKKSMLRIQTEIERIKEVTKPITKPEMTKIIQLKRKLDD